ncbi:MAG: glycosyltransferase family 2 protein [Planctomycetota bacterium]
MPTLSVFMTNYNHAAELPRALDALLGQSRPAEQIVIVDDGSTDESWSVLKRYANRHPSIALLRHETNRGVAAGIATALAACDSDWVYGAGSDDQVQPGFFASAMNEAHKHPDAGVIFGDVIAVYDDHRDDELQRIPPWSSDAPQRVSPERFASEHLAVDPAGFSLGAGTIYRRDALLAAGGFREALGSWCDTFAGRVLALQHGSVYLGQPATRWTATHRSFSHRSGDDDAHMQKIGATAAGLMRTEFAGLFPEDAVRRFETRWMLEMAGGYERVDDTLVPRRLRDVRRAYAEMSRDGRWFDRLLGGVLRALFARNDARRAQRSEAVTSATPIASSTQSSPPPSPAEAKPQAAL